MQPLRLTPETLRQALRDLPIASAAELAQRLQVSQPTVSRGLAALGEGVVRIGRTLCLVAQRRSPRCVLALAYH